MTGNETVKYLKNKYREGKDYGYIAVIVKKSVIEVWHAVPAMVDELKGMGFEEQGFCCRKSWQPATPESNWEKMLEESAKQRAQINFDTEAYGSQYNA